MKPSCRLVGASFCLACISTAASAEHLRLNTETVVVTGKRTPEAHHPGQSESIGAASAEKRVNVVNTEDFLKYLPSVLVRKRHIGDTQAPIATRTSGVGASARSLIYADGILLSALIGNNNTSASPRWAMLAPEDVARVDVMYGPFAAQYAGNSIGTVVEFNTRMPQTFEVNAKAQGALQSFSQYGTHSTTATAQLSAAMGDRLDRLSFRLSVNHLDTNSQPLSYVTLARPASPSGAGFAVTGATADVNRTGAPVAVLGAGGLEHQVQDNLTFKLAYDLTDDIQARYTFSLFNQVNNATIASYLHDAAGNPVYSGTVNIGGYAYAIGASAFSNGVSRLGQTHIAQGFSLGSQKSDNWQWDATLTLFDFMRDTQRVPTIALPSALSGGTGALTRMDGTGWINADIKAAWKFAADHRLSFGLHHDRYALAQRKFATADWLTGPQGVMTAQSRGKTATSAIWVQEDWQIAPHVKALVGGRLEHWRAFDGVNYSLSPALDHAQAQRAATRFSPKAAVTWQVSETDVLSASYGRAYRMPTVTELYQTVTTGTVLSVPNPDLKPERANSFELSAEHLFASGRVRVSFFEEHLSDALLTQSAPLGGSATLFNYVQNVDRTRARGVEIVAEQNNVLIDGLDFSGSITFVNGRILEDAAFPAAVGKHIPQLPKLRASLGATFRPNDDWALSLAARYSDRAFGTMDNSDTVANTYQGFGSYLVLDARIHYQIDDQWSAAVGVDNLNNRTYFIFHPFPQRTVLLELKYAH